MQCKPFYSTLGDGAATCRALWSEPYPLLRPCNHSQTMQASDFRSQLPCLPCRWRKTGRCDRGISPLRSKRTIRNHRPGRCTLFVARAHTYLMPTGSGIWIASTTFVTLGTVTHGSCEQRQHSWRHSTQTRATFTTTSCGLLSASPLPCPHLWRWSCL